MVQTFSTAASQARSALPRSISWCCFRDRWSSGRKTVAAMESAAVKRRLDASRVYEKVYKTGSRKPARLLKCFIKLGPGVSKGGRALSQLGGKGSEGSDDGR